MVAYSLDSRLRTIYISPYCLRLFGFSAAEIQEDHQFWDSHLHPGDRQRVLLQRERYLKNGKSYTLEYRIIHRNQSVRHIINHTIPVLSGTTIDCIDGFVFDITRRKYLEEQLVLTEKIKVLNNMSQGVAHEIRNPLTSIGGFARLLDKRMAIDDSNRPHLEIILKEVSRLEETLNRILDTLKPINLNQVRADINEIISRVLAQMGHEFREKEITVSTNLDDDIPTIEVDQILIEQALQSLLKATLQGLNIEDDLVISGR
jgi:PAS domain S-box-containing protein